MKTNPGPARRAGRPLIGARISTFISLKGIERAKSRAADRGVPVSQIYREILERGLSRAAP